MILMLALTLCPGRAALAWGDTGVRIARQRVRQFIRLDGKFRRFSDAMHLQGGIVAWAKQLEPDMVMY